MEWINKSITYERKQSRVEWSVVEQEHLSEKTVSNMSRESEVEQEDLIRKNGVTKGYFNR